MPRGHSQQFRRGPQNSGEPVPRAEQYPRAVLPPQPQRQRLVAGLGRGALALRRGDRLAGRGQGGLRLGQLLFRRLVPLGQFRVAGVEAVDLGLERLVLLLRGDGPLLGLVTGGGEAVDLGLGGGGA